MLLQVDLKEKTNKKVMLCLLLLFLLNGLASVLAAVYQSDLFSFEKPSAMQFSILRSIITMLFGMVGFFATRDKPQDSAQGKILQPAHIKSLPWALVGGVANGVANLLLLFALVKLEPSLQYPIVTGGSILLSALMGLFFKEKGNARTWTAVAIAVLGSIVIII